mmetsp:Transcript_4672/g.8813  ORF Transcript_4672/g.8813 Transcript_4672/m.8813 type:complete len:482 (-) Transcript_4672:599-2044(-)
MFCCNCRNFKGWRIKSQVSCFISAYFIANCLLLSFFYWYLSHPFKDDLLQETEDVLDEYIASNLRETSQELKGLVEFNCIQLATFILAADKIVSSVHGVYSSGVPPFEEQEPLMHDMIGYDDLEFSEAHGVIVTFESGVFYTPKETVSAEGYQLMRTASALDVIVKDLYFPPILNIYTGYEIDEIFHVYPGRKAQADYSPIVRDWYFNAKLKPETFFITEPYLDASDIWMISYSKALLNDRGVFGVVGIDLTVEIFVEAMSSLDYFSNGFFIFLSRTGIVIAQPDKWKTSLASMRIYESPYLKISEEQWGQIQSTSVSEDEIMSFEDIDGVKYIFSRRIIELNEDNDYIAYIMACAEEAEAYKQKDKVEQNYWRTKHTITVVLMTITIGTACTSYIMMCSVLTNASRVLRGMKVHWQTLLTRRHKKKAAQTFIEKTQRGLKSRAYLLVSEFLQSHLADLKSLENRGKANSAIEAQEIQLRA